MGLLVGWVGTAALAAARPCGAGPHPQGPGARGSGGSEVEIDTSRKMELQENSYKNGLQNSVVILS